MRLREIISGIIFLAFVSAAHAQGPQRLDLGAWLSGQPAATVLNSSDSLFVYQNSTDKQFTTTTLFANAQPTFINTSGGTTTFGTGTPLFIWSNQNGTNSAGQNTICRFWVGNNPTGTPGANNPVLCTWYIDNLNSRSGIWTGNFVTGQQAISSGGSGGIVHGLELDAYANIAANTPGDPFSAGSVTHQIEFVASSNNLCAGNTGTCGTGPNNPNATSPQVAAWTWSADSTAFGTGGNTAPPTWWAFANAAARVIYAGYVTQDYIGDAPSQSFQKASFWDRSSSAYIIKDGPNPVNASTPHTGVFDFTQSPGLGIFANQGSNNLLFQAGMTVGNPMLTLKNTTAGGDASLALYANTTAEASFGYGGAAGDFFIFSNSLNGKVMSAALSTGTVTFPHYVLASGVLATAAAAGASAGQTSFGNGTTAAGSGNCPTGTIGTKTVVACINLNVGTYAAVIPYF